MTSNLIKICYEGETGSSNIRTFYNGNILYISLTDILITLSKENRELDERYTIRSTAQIIQSQLEVLDDDEYLNTGSNQSDQDADELFVTQPGLYRVLSNDRSKAGKRFQKWLYHEVIPSLAKHGCYPPPQSSNGSALSQMAEIVALNARTLANAIVRQDQLETQVRNINQRVASIETAGRDLKHIITVRDRLDQLSIRDIDEEMESEIVIWCENLNLKYSDTRISCPSGDRLKARFTARIIDEATYLVREQYK